MIAKKKAQAEIDYRLSKWVIRILEEERLLLPDEIRSIWSELLSFYDPFTRSVEVVSGSMRGDGIGKDNTQN